MATYRNGQKRGRGRGVMRAKITKRTLESLEPEEKVYEVVDTELAGFVELLRVIQ